MTRYGLTHGIERPLRYVPWHTTDELEAQMKPQQPD